MMFIQRVVSVFFLVAPVTISACAKVAVPPPEAQSEAGCSERDANDEEDLAGETSDEPVCSEPVSVAKCVFTHPACAPDRPAARYLTHGSHECDGSYPPKLCEYVGDISCDGKLAGVWCCP